MQFTGKELDNLIAMIDEVPMTVLRRWAFDGGLATPTQKEADKRFKGWTRGQLIVLILEQKAGLLS